MESLTVTFTDEEWAELKTVARREDVSVEKFAHDTALAGARSHEAREAQLRVREAQQQLLREESAALMDDPNDRAAMRQLYDELEWHAPDVPN